MNRIIAGALLALMISIGSLFAAEATATLKSIDTEKGVIVVVAGNGAEHTMRADKNLKVMDSKGAVLIDGLKSKDLKPGVQVIVTFEIEQKQAVLKMLKLGDRNANPNILRGIIKQVDADKGVVIVEGAFGTRTLKLDKNSKLHDEKGTALADGLKARELKVGAGVQVLGEYDGKDLVLKALKLDPSARGKDPNKTSLGFKPLNEMTAEDKYEGEDGGLYGGGKNEPPEAHAAAAKKETSKIVPLDAEGKPSKDGKIVFISIGYSNVEGLFGAFKTMADADNDKSSQVSIVNCAQGGQTMFMWANLENKNWSVAEERLKRAGVTPKQVQVIWMKLANAGPKGKMSEHAKKLHDNALTTLQNLKARFPNLRIAYLGSRIYGGYSLTGLNPEPFAYEGAYAVRWLIQEQIKGDEGLNFDADKGAVKAPLLLWGPYLWADGTTPRKSDGLVWNYEDVVFDGVHPSRSGEKKVAEMLLKFLKTDSNAKTWFAKPAKN